MQRANLRSIDTFLTLRPQYRECGKQAIAAALLPRENPDALWRQPTLEWYEFVFDAVHEWVFRRPDALSIITFNYDRSLEVSLLHAMLSGLGMTADDAFGNVERLNIEHVHGDLGILQQRPYATPVTPPAVIEAAKRIRLAGEPRDSSSSNIGFWLAEASRLCFLGFGFHPDNVDSLRLRELLNDKTKLYGTAYDMMDGEKGEAMGLVGRAIEFGPPTDDCVTLLRRQGILGPP